MADTSVTDEFRDLLVKTGRSFDEREPSESQLTALLEWESEAGLTFPEDYRECVLRFGGQVLGAVNRPYVARGGGRRALFRTESVGDFFAMPRPSGFDRERYRVTYLFELAHDEGHIRETDWAKDLLPIAGIVSNGLFCFDFKYDRQNPPVVYVDYQDEWNDGGELFSGVCYVAGSFVEFFQGMEIYDGETHSWPTEDLAPAVISPAQEQWEKSRNRWLGL